MQLAFHRGVDGSTPKPVAQSIAQIGDMIVELGMRQSSDIRHIADPLDGGPPDGEYRRAVFVDMIRQRGGFAHGWRSLHSDSLAGLVEGHPSPMLPIFPA